MKKTILLIAFVFGLIGIALANVSTWTTDGKNVIVYDHDTNNSFVANMDYITHQVNTVHSLYWVMVNSAAQGTIEHYEDSLNNAMLNAGK